MTTATLSKDYKVVTAGVYKYDVLGHRDYVSMQTCGVSPQRVYDLLHPAHDVCGGGNCLLFKADGSYKCVAISALPDYGIVAD